MVYWVFGLDSRSFGDEDLVGLWGDGHQLNSILKESIAFPLQVLDAEVLRRVNLVTRRLHE